MITDRRVDINCIPICMEICKGMLCPLDNFHHLRWHIQIFTNYHLLDSIVGPAKL